METWADIVTGEHEIVSHRRPKTWYTVNWQLTTIATLILFVAWVCVWVAGFVAGYVVLR